MFKAKSSMEEPLAGMFTQQPDHLSWLVFLLTGDRTWSAGAQAEASGSKDAAKPFFEKWMAVWSRKVWIARALAGVNSAMSDSVLRTAALRPDHLRKMKGPSPAAWRLETDTDKLEFESALLAIDVFPRCALLLTVFEKLSLEEVANLLNVDKPLVATARTVAWTELSRRMQRTSPGFVLPDSVHADQPNVITKYFKRIGYGTKTFDSNREIWGLVVQPKA